MLRVVEIFSSVEGEGKRAGLPCTFVRLFGCNLRCSYCDTPYGWADEYEAEAKEMSVDEVMDAIRKIGIPNVTITGGEPLCQPAADYCKLLTTLQDEKFWVNIETNGSKTLRCHDYTQVFYTVDYKTNASGMTHKMDVNVFKTLRPKDVLKFVVGSLEDCEQAREVIQKYNSECDIYFSPVFGKIEPKDIVKFIMDNKLYQCHVQVQLHKVIWDPEQRGV